MKKLSKQNKFILGLLASIILILFTGRMLVLDLAFRAAKDAQQLKLAEARLKQSLQIQNKSQIIASDYAKYQPYLVTDTMPARQVVEELLREIERIAKDSSVEIINLTPQGIPDEKDKKKEYSADLRLECTGTDRLLSFLNGIQESKFLIVVSKFALTAKDQQGVVLKAEMTLSLSTE
jgi:hypothetical protein